MRSRVYGLCARMAWGRPRPPIYGAFFAPRSALLARGRRSRRHGLEALAADLGLEEAVTFTGVVQREDVARHIAAFDIALQPAVTAYASPLKLFEYMALGKAIIAPAQPNILEVLKADEEALLFDSEVEGAFDKALTRLLDEDALRSSLGARARARLIASDFTWDGNAARVEEAARALLGLA